MNAIDRINDQRKRIEALKSKRSVLAGQLEQMEAQYAEGMERLKKEHGVETLEQAEAEIARLRTQVSEDELAVEALIKKAEQVLGS